MKNKIKQIDEMCHMTVYARHEPVLAYGDGSAVYDADGKKYIDFTSGIGVNSLGFCDDGWVDAVSTQAAVLAHTSNYFANETTALLAKSLCDMTGFSKVFFSNSGAEANECAIKLARKYSFDKYGAETGRNKILTFENSFHGRTMTTLTATGQDVMHDFFFPFMPGFDYIIPGDTVELEKKCENGDVCAVMIEIVQGEGGVIPIDADYLKFVDKFCKANDILLIADEVQTGIGRTGAILASEIVGIKPDITTLAKGLGGGLPIGATLCSETLADVFVPGNHGSTFGGNPVVCAGALVVLSKMQGLLDEVKEKGDYIRKKVSEFKNVKSVRGMGLMIGIDTEKPAADVVAECLNNGLLVLTAKSAVRFLPPLNISYEDIDTGLGIFKRVVETI